jgi:hypothetical protein
LANQTKEKIVRTAKEQVQSLGGFNRVGKRVLFCSSVAARAGVSQRTVEAALRRGFWPKQKSSAKH